MRGVSGALAVLIAVSAPVQAKGVRIGSWLVRVSQEPTDDAAFVVAFATESDTRGSYMRLSCEEGRASIAFAVPGFIFGGSESLQGRVRIDDEETPTAAFAGIRSTNLFGTALSQAIYGRLGSARQVAIDATSMEGTTWKFVYYLSRTEDAIVPMLDACPISSAAPITQERKATP